MLNIPYVQTETRKRGLEELTDSIVSKVDIRLFFRNFITNTLYDTPNFDKVFDKRTTSNLSRQLARIRINQRKIYESTLDSISSNLEKPISMHISGGNASVKLRIKKYSGGFLSTTEDRIYLGWKDLSDKTKDIKSGGSKYSKTYWKHTGSTSRVFKAAVSQRKKTLNDNDFMTSPAEIVRQLNSSIYSKGEGVRGLSKVLRASANIEIKVPKWQGKDADLMDDLITKPYAGVKSNSMFSYLKSSMVAAQDRVYKARDKERQDGIRRHYANMKAEEKANRASAKPAKADAHVRAMRNAMKKNLNKSLDENRAARDAAHAERWAKLTPAQREAEIPF